MKLKLNLISAADTLPPVEELADAARYGVEVLIKNHLRSRNNSRPPRGLMPKTNYYADAAESVTSATKNNQVEVTISQEGIALHYYGGRILPFKGKALAIPKHPTVYDQKPSEFDPSRMILNCVWPKGRTAGTLRHKESGEILYLLIPRANIPADRTVLPNETDITAAANNAMESII